MVTFVSMSRQEAKSFLAEFTAQTPARLDALRRDSATQGGPGAQALDLSPASLGPLWSWASTRLAFRDGWTFPESGEPSRRFAPEELEPADQLPQWFDPDFPGWDILSAPTLWLVDGLARYFGETLVRNVPGAGWAAGHARTKGYVYQNHPVVAGLPSDDCEPMAVVAVVVIGALRGRGETNTLPALYDVRTGH